MHCYSCEILIEKKVLELPQVRKARAILSERRLIIEFEDEAPSLESFRQLFSGDDYQFSENRFEEEKRTSWWSVFFYSAIVLGVFFLISRLKMASVFNIPEGSSLGALFALGLLAGFSTCAALIGGLVLSMSKQWNEKVSGEISTARKMIPHFFFNAGRILSFSLAGMLLGLLGEKLQVSISFSAFFTIAVSIIMIILGLQMLGVRSLQRFQIALPRFVTRRIASTETNGKIMPFAVGFLTILLPCGFTLSAEGLAILSTSAPHGSMIMLFFVLGTSPALLLVGLTSVKFFEKKSLARKFTKVAGIIVLFFALYNINMQLTVLDWPNWNSSPAENNIEIKNTNADKSLAPIVNGKQLIQMSVADEFFPNHFKVRAGIPVVWEIQDAGFSGCTGAIIARSLFPGYVQLSRNDITIKEFIPKTPGRYQFSCPMGMVVGIIEVVK
ncbi:sulfite exporter TauE/SafE family protein [Patescibacteria group bacterium]|nr:sulfite exporter TauE/SafE family protein [Patescibacteria group bacterium]